MKTADIKTSAVLLAVLVVALVASYLFLVLRMSVNMPLLDDYNFFYDILRIEDHGSLHRKMFSVVAQHNEHRIAFARMVALGQLYSTGQIHFGALAFIGNLGLLVAALAVAWGVTRRREDFGWSLAVVVAVLLNPFQGYQMFWAMPALSNYWSVGLSLVALALLNGSWRYGFPAAALTGAVAAFSSGQGLVLLPVALLNLLVARRWREASGWVLWCLILWFAYFKLHHSPAGNPSSDDPVKIAQWFLVLIGSAPAQLIATVIPWLHLGGAEQWTWLRAGAGVVTGVLAAVLIWLNYQRGNLFYCAALSYVILLCAAAAVSRAFLPVSYALSTQYRNWSLLILALLAVGAVLRKNGDCRSRAFMVVFILALAGNLAMWHSEWIFIEKFHDYRMRSREHFLSTGDLFAAPPRPQDIQFAAALAAQNRPDHIFKEHLVKDTERKYKERILWRGYLYGTLPLSDFHWDKGIHWSAEKLERICGPLQDSDAATSDPSKAAAEPVLLIESLDGRFLISPAAAQRLRPAGSGLVWRRSKSAMAARGGWGVLLDPKLLLKDKSLAPSERLFVVMPRSE